jgi:hypothetical protein
MIKPWVPSSYSGCLKWSPSISRYTAVYHMAFSQTRLNMLASTVVTDAWSLAMRCSIVLGGMVYMCSFRCLTGKNPSELDLATEKATQHPIHLPGCVTFSHCWTSSPECTGALLCWNQNLCPTARGKSSDSPSRTVSRKSQYWAVSLLGSRWHPQFQPKCWH